MRDAVDVLIVGAGPFGLSVAAMVSHLRIDHLVVGEPMGFWKSNMPDGMLLRSGSDWHLDPLGHHTIERFLGELQLTPSDVEPLSRGFYLDYAEWFQQQKRIEPFPATIRALDFQDGAQSSFVATLTDGTEIRARRVVLAVGFRYFKYVPEELAALFPSELRSHTCDAVDFVEVAGQRVLIIGGRQSAFEWAALLCERGAAAVHVSYRHETPSFTPSDWTWTTPLLDGMVEDPGWYRRLSAQQKHELGQRMWGEGRLKLEPWLASRLDPKIVSSWSQTEVVHCERRPAGELLVSLDSGHQLRVDRVIFATGYKVDMTRVPLLAQSEILSRLRTRNGYPVLDEHFQTSVPGLFITSMPAIQDFGPFFGFTVSVRTSARLIGGALAG